MLRIGGFRPASRARIVYVGGERGLVLKLMPSAQAYNEVSRYRTVASYIPVPRLIFPARLGSWGVILYERSRSLGNGFELLADAFFRQDEQIVRGTISEVLDTYATLIDRTLRWEDRTETNLAYFDDRIRSHRLRDWYQRSSLFTDFVVSSKSNGFRVVVRKILEYLTEWAEHPRPTFSILSQGDPTEVNIGVPLCFFDFGAAGRNAILGDMANLIWSIHGQGGYFAPTYNPVAVEFRSFVDQSIERNRPQISFQIDECRRTIEVDGGIVPDDCRSIALSLFAESALWSSTKSLFLTRGLKAEAELLPYLLCRVLFVFDPRRMDIKDRIALLASAAELYCKGADWYLNQFTKQNMKTASTQVKRVRCLLRVPNRGFVLIKRVKLDEPAYYVFPGGGIESSDASPEDALRRELQEELGATIADLHIVGDSVSGNGELERFFYAECSNLEVKFVGEEKALPGRGSYDLVFVTSSADLIGKNILPSAANTWLKEAISNP